LKAAVSARYGPPDVIQICDVPKPDPGSGEVLIKVHSTTVSRTDNGMLRPIPFAARLFVGVLRPKLTILGMDFAGEVEAVAPGVNSFKPGDRVFGMSPVSYGAHAEYFCLSEKGPIAIMPQGTGFDEAVLCEGAWYANNCLTKMNLGPGQKILIYGGSGAIGSAAVQLAKSYGAEVTAVVHSRHIELVRSLGADHAIDYTTGDFTRSDETFDCVMDAVGKTTFFHCRKLLKSGGVYSATDLGPWAQNAFLAIWSSLTGRTRVIFPLPAGAGSLVRLLKSKMEAGEIHAVIDRKYPLDEIADAYRYVETEQKTGIVVINVDPGE
jgi:NADPH:quinone reductase-like Zn-dependent oxidoreductase